MVEITPKHFFMLTPLGSTHKWHVIYYPNGPVAWDNILTIPALKDLKQGETFDLHKDEATSVVAFVESEYANDRDIGVRIIDNATGQVKHECTLLTNVSRYQWVADVIVEKDAK